MKTLADHTRRKFALLHFVSPITSSPESMIVWGTARIDGEASVSWSMAIEIPSGVNQHERVLTRIVTLISDAPFDPGTRFEFRRGEFIVLGEIVPK